MRLQTPELTRTPHGLQKFQARAPRAWWKSFPSHFFAANIECNTTPLATHPHRPWVKHASLLFAPLCMQMKSLLKMSTSASYIEAETITTEGLFSLLCSKRSDRVYRGCVKLHRCAFRMSLRSCLGESALQRRSVIWRTNMFPKLLQRRSHPSSVVEAI